LIPRTIEPLLEMTPWYRKHLKKVTLVYENMCLNISTDTLSTYFMLERTHKLHCILRVYHSSLFAMAQRRLLEPSNCG
jgi:hypothetical protein